MGGFAEPPFGFSTTMRCMNVSVVPKQYVILQFTHRQAAPQATNPAVEALVRWSPADPAGDRQAMMFSAPAGSRRRYSDPDRAAAPAPPRRWHRLRAPSAAR